MNGIDIISNYKSLVVNLERQELESSLHGSASPQIYGQLLAIYLLMNDLPNAKLLWKRIPEEIKKSNPEIQSVWNVGVKLFRRELSSVYSLVDEVEWPSHLKNIMNCIKDVTRERMLNLIGNAYTTIRFSDIVLLMGLNDKEAIDRIQSVGWVLDRETMFVTPKALPKISTDSSPATFDELLIKLTEHVSFLEN